jgi:hypothetical protein
MTAGVLNFLIKDFRQILPVQEREGLSQLHVSDAADIDLDPLEQGLIQPSPHRRARRQVSPLRISRQFEGERDVGFDDVPVGFGADKLPIGAG